MVEIYRCDKCGSNNHAHVCPQSSPGVDRGAVLEEAASARPPRSSGSPPNGRWGGQYQCGWDDAVIAYSETIRALTTPQSDPVVVQADRERAALSGMTRYTAHGKQVMRGTEHIADATDATYAQIIADALNGERVSSGPGEVCYAPRYQANETAMIAEVTRHTVTQYNDGERRKCTCGRSWDRDEGDKCPGAAS